MLTVLIAILTPFEAIGTVEVKLITLIARGLANAAFIVAALTGWILIVIVRIIIDVTAALLWGTGQLIELVIFVARLILGSVFRVRSLRIAR